MTSKMIQRAAYEKEMKEQDAMESDEHELELFEGDESGENKQDVKGKGKETPPPTINEDTHISRNKRRRPVVDPFAGMFYHLPPDMSLIIYCVDEQDTAATLHHAIVLQPKK